MVEGSPEDGMREDLIPLQSILLLEGEGLPEEILRMLREVAIDD